jgi:hypothetical protein
MPLSSKLRDVGTLLADTAKFHTRLLRSLVFKGALVESFDNFRRQLIAPIPATPPITQYKKPPVAMASESRWGLRQEALR